MKSHANVRVDNDENRLTTEAVERTALPLERVYDVERCDRLALGVLSVCDSVPWKMTLARMIDDESRQVSQRTDDTLEEALQATAGLLVDHGGDTLDTATASQTADSGLGDTLDVVAQNLPVALGTALSEALAAFSACEDASVTCG